MNLQTLFQDFNPSKFLVYSCLLIFTLLFALRLDDVINWNYWVIFLPIWFWKSAAILGALMGSYVWWRHPQYRVEGEGYVHYKAMLICLALHLLLLMFELLVCDKLENNRHFWILVFIPLIFISIISIAICIWSVKHDRSFELELFCSVNILQFIFLALRLDEFIIWSWVVVFVPLWIVMCLALIGVLYAIIFATILLRSNDVNPEHRRTSVNSAVAYSFLVVPMLVAEVLVANKLDGDPKALSFVASISPMFLSYLSLICMAFGSKGGNHWWFGIRKDFCHFLLGACPLLQEYGNISYTLQSDERDNPDELITRKMEMSHRLKSYNPEPRVIIPKLAIEMPD
uniref:Transmembrane protein 185A n=1 Tax=Strigamia maritima TaxID=126957 RepID=T1IRI0_STRMM